MPVEPEPSPPTRREPAADGPSVATRAVIAGAILIGLIIRLAVVARPPTSAMLWDHHEYVKWGVQMVQDGLWGVYTHGPSIVPLLSPKTGQVVQVTPADDLTPCNYPPFSVYVLYGQARVLQALDPQMVSNTPTARLLYSSVAFCCDFLIAAGCWAIVRRRRPGLPAAIAFAFCALAPPFIIDSAHWGQTDTWLLAPLVWMLWLMLTRRWLLAGLLWGLALAIKPQALLVAPLWLAAFLLARGQRRTVFAAGAAAPLVLLLIGLPFTINAGWTWLRHAYVDNLVHFYPRTTMKAFNIWYVDLLLTENDDATRTIAGITKDGWGKLLLLGSILGSIAIMVRRRQAPLRTLVPLAAAVLLLCVVVPTRVHERYIIVPLPFLIAAAGLDRRLWWPVVPLVLAASYQMTALDWMAMGANSWSAVRESVHNQYEELRRTLPPEDFATLPPPEQQLAAQRSRFAADRWNTGDPVREWTLVVVELTSAAVCLVLLLGPPRSPHVVPPPLSASSP